MKSDNCINCPVTREIVDFKDVFTNQWFESEKLFPKLDKKTSFFQKRAKEKSTNVFVDSFVKSLKSFPEEIEERLNWKKNIKVLMDNFLQQSDLISTSLPYSLN